MSTPITLKHDDPEAALPHQVEPPPAWGLKLPDAVQFTVHVPKWCPVDDDALVDLHWWASLVSHLYVLLPLIQADKPVHYGVEKSLRQALQTLRDLYGSSMSAAISGAGMEARSATKAELDGYFEIGMWTMAIQTSFGLLCTRTVAKGKHDPIAVDLAGIYEWLCTSFDRRLKSAPAFAMLIALCTGTVGGTVDEKLDQWKQALARAAEGAPEGAAGVAEALESTQT